MAMATTASTTSITSVTLEVADPEAVRRFYTALKVDTRIRLRASEAHSTGFRGFTLALTVSQPATVDSFLAAAVDAGATVLKPAAKSLRGYGGVIQAPDGTIWKVATSAKRDTGPATRVDTKCRQESRVVHRGGSRYSPDEQQGTRSTRVGMNPGTASAQTASRRRSCPVRARVCMPSATTSKCG